jgi:hypothetical protein
MEHRFYRAELVYVCVSTWVAALDSEITLMPEKCHMGAIAISRWGVQRSLKTMPNC